MRVRGTAREEKQILIYRKNNDGTIKCYCDEGYQEISQDQFSFIRKNPISSDFMLVPAETRDKKIKLLSLKKQYKLFCETADRLKVASDNKINMYKTGATGKTTLQLFFSFNPPNPEKIEEDEATIINLCKCGGVIWGEQYEGKAYKFDFVSFFCSIMRSQSMQFPIGQPEFKTMTADVFDKKEFFTFGIYHAQIISIVDKKLFTVNEQNWYTHIDLNRAKALGYEMELIEDGEYNHLCYRGKGKLINGAKLFRPFVDYLFGLRQIGYEEVKQIMSALWGALCQYNEMTVRLSKDDEIFDPHSITTMTKCKNGDRIITTVKADRRFDYDFARMKPFLLAKCRTVVSQLVELNLDSVKRIYIDGFLFTDKKVNLPKGIEIGKNIGNLRYEGRYADCKILNARDVEGELIKAT